MDWKGVSRVPRASIRNIGTPDGHSLASFSVLGQEDKEFINWNHVEPLFQIQFQDRLTKRLPFRVPSFISRRNQSRPLFGFPFICMRPPFVCSFIMVHRTAL